MPIKNQITSSESPTSTRLAIQLSPNALLYTLTLDSKIVACKRIAYTPHLSPSANLQRILETEPMLQPPHSQVVVLLETERVCMAPHSWSQPETEAQYLALLGFELQAEETVLQTFPTNGIVAHVAVDAALIALLSSRYESISFLHPLQICLSKPHTVPTVEINLTYETVNLVVQDTQLRYCEVLPCSRIEELLFYLTHLDTLFSLRHYQLIFSGEGAENVQKNLRRYFRHTTLDKDLPSFVKRSMRSSVQPFHNLIYCNHANY